MRTKPIKTTSHLTAGFGPVLTAQIRKSYPGMAHFAATGPFGRVCSECTHYGCYEQIHNVAGDLVKTEHHPRACAKFLSLTGKLGPAIPAETEACRHFRER